MRSARQAGNVDNVDSVDNGDNVDNVDNVAHQIWGEYSRQHFARGGVCQFWAKIQLKTGKRSFYIKNTKNIYQKYKKGETFAILGGHRMLANVPFYKNMFFELFGTSVLASLDPSEKPLS